MKKVLALIAIAGFMTFGISNTAVAQTGEGDSLTEDVDTLTGGDDEGNDETLAGNNGEGGGDDCGQVVPASLLCSTHDSAILANVALSQKGKGIRPGNNDTAKTDNVNAGRLNGLTVRSSAQKEEEGCPICQTDRVESPGS